MYVDCDDDFRPKMLLPGVSCCTPFFGVLCCLRCIHSQSRAIGGLSHRTRMILAIDEDIVATNDEEEDEGDSGGGVSRV